MDLLTRDVTATFEMIGWADRGTFPVSGGVLDQSAKFLEAMGFANGETRKIEAAQARRRRAFKQD